MQVPHEHLQSLLPGDTRGPEPRSFEKYIVMD